MTFSRRILSASLATGLAVALAACSGSESSEEALAGEPIAAIPAPDGQEWIDQVTVTEADGYLVGNPDAPLKLIEYASHTCGGCAFFSVNGAPPLKADYISSGIVSLELRNLVRDSVDLTIATLVRCGAPSSMQPLSDQAWANFNEVVPPAIQFVQQARDLVNLDTGEQMVRIAEGSGLLDFFAARGLSSDQARTCLADSEAVQAIAERSRQQAQELNVAATPTFFLNGQKLEASQWEQLEPILQRAGAR